MAINLKQGFVIYGVVAVVLFMVGRCTAPRPENNELEKARIAQLEAENKRLLKSVDSLEWASQINREKAETYFKEAQAKQKEKIVYRTRQNEEVKRIDSFDDRQLDSAFRARYPGTYGDR